MNLTKNLKSLEVTVSKLVAKAWMDDEFRKRFISEPTEILREAGVFIEDFVKIVVNQDSTNAPVLQGADGMTIYQINLPPKPSDLSDEQISAWSLGGVDVASACRSCC
ncbi:MAG: hypothetical protein IGR93_20810 [Hydrococcus sp. C42_A2020_068]|uniref:nitrile hydratase subunit alpha n=1 Tax=Pleurocapsa sp. PCC 7327 TaxID=118163 RepID=UPI00029FE1D0|nr:nitrile hydratase subunit alpha [Pleurocapsa sp. PCC 7327]AFY76985.1 Nitrile hydratase, alpha chain [Pleurocapsa sp. PCC 7327]MBF2022464.1 hypothetical protein [Hydrococcus sp. C42_A2020_068]